MVHATFGCMEREKTTATAHFGGRLVKLMRERGHVSETARSGVDVAKLAEIAGCSYEMARRYAEGLAMPRPAKVEAIATWLGADAGYLAWGEATTTAAPTLAVDTGVLEECLMKITEAQRLSGRALSSEKAAALVSLVYQDAIEGRSPTVQGIVRLMKLL